MSQQLARSAGMNTLKIGVTGNTLRPVHDTQSSVLLRFPHQTGIALFFVFGGATWAIFNFVPDLPRLLIGGMFGLVTGVIGIASFWREEVELSFASGQWRMRRGFVWSGVKETRGALAEIPEVELVVNRRSSSEDSSPSWLTRIQAPTWPGPITVASHVKEEKGYAELEKWAKRLRIDAVDRTGDQEIRTAWARLDEPWGGRAAGAVHGDGADAALAAAYASEPRARVSEHPPAGSRVVVTSEKGRRRILLPAIGFNTGVGAMALFGLVFGGMGLMFALVASTIIPNVRVNGEIPTSPVWPMVIMGLLFALIGLLIIIAPWVGSRAHEWIEDSPDALVVGYSGLGLTWGVKRLPKRTIEGIDISVSPSAEVGMRERHQRAIGKAVDDDPRDLRIRTDAKVIRIGRYLSTEDLRWLHDRVEALVRG